MHQCLSHGAGLSNLCYNKPILISACIFRLPLFRMTLLSFISQFPCLLDVLCEYLSLLRVGLPSNTSLSHEIIFHFTEQLLQSSYHPISFPKGGFIHLSRSTPLLFKSECWHPFLRALRFCSELYNHTLHQLRHGSNHLDILLNTPGLVSLSDRDLLNFF